MQALLSRMAAPRLAWALAPLVFVADAARHAVEGSMLLHMVLQFPLLLASGVASAWLAAGLAPRLAARWQAIDRGGLLGMMTVSSVSALWMVPAALDAALLHADVAALKYASWWFSGFAIALAWPRMHAVLRMFFLGNLAWMLATAGMLYADTEQRLCVNYRFDEQAWTGIALMAAGGALVLAVMGFASRESWSTHAQTTSPRARDADH